MKGCFLKIRFALFCLKPIGHNPVYLIEDQSKGDATHVHIIAHTQFLKILNEFLSFARIYFFHGSIVIKWLIRNIQWSNWFSEEVLWKHSHAFRC